MNKLCIVLITSVLVINTQYGMDIKEHAAPVDHHKLVELIEAGQRLSQLQDVMTPQNVNPELTGAEPFIRFVTPLHAAINRDDVELVTSLIKLGASVTVPLAHYDTHLHICLRKKAKNYVQIAKILIDSGADVNAENAQKQTPKKFAAEIDNTHLRDLFGLKKPLAEATAPRHKPKTSAVVTPNNDSGYSWSWLASRGVGVLVCAIIANKLYADVFGDAQDKDDEDDE